MADEFKDFIDDLFEQKRAGKTSKPNESSEPPYNKKPSRKLSIPEPPPKTQEQQEKAIKYARQEIESIRQAFLDFSEKVNHTIMYDHLYPHIEDFVEVCQDLTALVEDDVDKSEMTNKGLDDYERMRKIRARLLDYVLEKYEKGE